MRDILDAEYRRFKVADLRLNEGQLECIGVHANPRLINDAQYKKLVVSLKNKNLTGVLPLKVYEHDGEWYVLGGNMRLRAMLEAAIQETRAIVIPSDTDAETLNEIIIKDNATFGDWDFDALGNWNEPLADWGVDVPNGGGVEVDKIISAASSEDAIKEYSDDTNYNLERLYRSRVNEDIMYRINKGVADGKIRPEIADVLRTRAQQCAIFNFDELCKFFRSNDATIEEKELLQRLYLVFVAPAEMVAAGILKVKEIANIIYDDNLMTNNDAEAD